MTAQQESDGLARARAGDEHAFAELTAPYRRELQLHCYRIVGSAQDAEDLVQETLLAAWRGLDGFEGRSSVRTWLHRVATNCSLDALRARDRRPRRIEPMPDPPRPTRMADTVWLQPYADALLDGIADDAPGPEARYAAREAVGLAFVAGLQRLPPLQRAVLVLRDVLGYRAAEVAEMLGTTTVAVNGQLTRARAAFESRLPASGPDRTALPASPLEREVVARFADAIEAGDVDALTALLTEDAWVTMPPQPFEYQGRAVIGAFLADRWGRLPAPFRTVATRANGQPAFALYTPAPPARIARPHGLIVLTLDDGAVAEITFFADTAVFPQFGLPRSLPLA